MVVPLAVVWQPRQFGLTNENNTKDPKNFENLGKNTNNTQHLETEPIEEEIESGKTPSTLLYKY